MLSFMLLTALTTSCSTFNNIKSGSSEGFEKSEPLRSNSEKPSLTDPEAVADSDESAPSLTVSDTPRVAEQPTMAAIAESDLGSKLKGPDIAVNFNQLPLPAFINEVFGKLLKLSYTLDPRLNAQQDLVTLSLAKPQSPSDLYRTARFVLADYGISIRQRGETLRFTADKDASGSSIPLMVTGRALPSVPASHRPVFSLVPLTVVRNTLVTKWLKELFKGKEVSVFEDPERNSILIRGPMDAVQQAIDAIELLDQPILKGKHAKVLSPAFSPVKELSRELVKVLSAEGYAASETPPMGSLIVLPLEEAKRIVVFAGSEEILAHVIEWAELLDQKQQKEISEGVFRYEVQNVQATHIASLLGQLAGNNAAVRQEEGSTREPKVEQTAQTKIADGFLVVDMNLNYLYFKGSGQAWLDLLPTIKEMDRPVPSVLLEVLLAEVTLNDQEDSGVEWLFRSEGVDDYNLTGRTLSALDLGGSGLTLTFDSAGTTRAAINAFYRNSRAVIRSSPRILVKSGEEASIEVGNDIPIITSNTQSINGDDTPVIQTIQYRKTGVLLTVKPVVQASGLVDIDISQELSEQQLATASSTGSPIILTRKLQTTLTLRDGGSVLLGGLISSSQSEGEEGIPGIGKIPLLGKLFRTNSLKEDRTELLILVVPYVIETNAQAIDLTESFRQKLSIE